MRAVIQRIERAKVSVEGREVSATGAGLLVFFGVEAGDGEGDADFLAEKIVHLRIFEDHDGKMNRSLKDVNGQMLVVSQFTLLGDCRKGRRPSFGRAEAPERAHALYDHFIRCVAKRGIDAAAGIFQAMMKVELVNDGPVTLLLDTRASSGSGRDGNLDRT